MDKKHLFDAFLKADPARIHLAAHSHHPWPDVAKDAQLEAWNDATLLADRKWEKVFGELLPASRRHVARLLGLPGSDSLAFAPNTHELLLRIFSCLPPGRTHRILTTDSEFHSFDRQVRRFEEAGLAEVTRVTAEPFETFAERFQEAAHTGTFDLVFFSQVFFNSGYVVREVEEIVSSVREADTFVVVDGYHSFCAIPLDLSKLASRAFFLAGGYKYAMSGEGVCFLHAPDGFGERPVDTGWFASFGSLAEKEGGPITYAKGGARFLGATFDPSGLYRFRRVMDLLEREGLTVASVHAHVLSLQEKFLELLRDAAPPALAGARLVVDSANTRGRFLTFDFGRAKEAHERLLERNVVTDVRGSRLRFGLGLYHAETDLAPAVARIVDALR